MQIKKLNASEIITTKDFPVYNEHILKIYFTICKSDSKILPPTPVVPISAGLPLLNAKTKKEKEYNKRMRKYLKENKKVKYIMCDGSHKTTALTLTNNKIHCAILENNKDVNEFISLVKVGEIFSFAAGNTIKKILREKAEHLKDANFFETVKDKTKRMVDKKVIPNYMIEYYKNK